jgi:16S rRNA G966 N2-methylase RsmD
MEPKVIYMQKDEEGEFYTWCEEKINDDDTAYVPESSMLALQEENKRYKDALEFNPLAEKLSMKKKQFIVVAIDEPYFKDVYDAIRKEEKRKFSWNQEDEIAYIEALKMNQSALNGGK